MSKLTKRKTNTTIPHDKFCREYMKAFRAGKTTDDLAKSLGINKQSVSARKAAIVDKYGVTFPPLKRSLKSERISKATIAAILKTTEKDRVKAAMGG